MEDNLPLGYKEQPNPPPRPGICDESIRRAAVESLMPDIVRWYGKGWKEAEREEIIDDLLKATARGVSDGYEIAVELERRFHWYSVNAELVDTLDDFSGVLWTEHRKAVERWVEANVIRPKLSVGTVVKTRDGIGPIVKIGEAEGVYIVQTEEYRTRWPDQIARGGGIVLPYEDCEPVR